MEVTPQAPQTILVTVAEGKLNSTHNTQLTHLEATNRQCKTPIEVRDAIMVAYSEVSGGHIVSLENTKPWAVPNHGCLKTWTLYYSCNYQAKGQPCTCQAKMTASASQLSHSEWRVENLHLSKAEHDHKPPIRKKLSLLVKDKVAEIALTSTSVADCRHTVKKLYRGKVLFVFPFFVNFLGFFQIGLTKETICH